MRNSSHDSPITVPMQMPSLNMLFKLSLVGAIALALTSCSESDEELVEAYDTACDPDNCDPMGDRVAEGYEEEPWIPRQVEADGDIATDYSELRRLLNTNHCQARHFFFNEQIQWNSSLGDQFENGTDVERDCQFRIVEVACNNPSFLSFIDENCSPWIAVSN